MLKSKVMTIANKLVSKGYSRSVAMVKAWVIAKAESLKTRVAGVTKLFRQEALQAIEKAIPANVGITLKHEQFNRYDSNAVAVYATIQGQTDMLIGYLPRAVAFVVAPLIDKGITPIAKGVTIVGGFNEFVSYGARLQIKI